MVIETQRLLIKPLTVAQLSKYSNMAYELEAELDLNVSPRHIERALADAIQQMIQTAPSLSADQFLFFTLWTIIDKKKRVMVGDLCFKGPPTTDGEVEVGYGTHEVFWNQGYMTEALAAVVDWARKQPAIQTILAETDQANEASCRTLIKNQFEPFRQDGDMLWWRLTVK